MTLEVEKHLYGARLCRGIGRAAMCADDEDEEEEEEASEEKEARAVRGCVNVRLPSVAMDLCIGRTQRSWREREGESRVLLLRPTRSVLA